MKPSCNINLIKRFILFAIFITIGFVTHAQHSAPDTIIAYRCPSPIKLDGKLNEPCWQKARTIENFTQREQNEGAKATEKTKVVVVYDTSKIYFGIWCYDSHPQKISAQKMARDFNWRSDDNIEIFISTFNDNRNGYLFATNPNGALADVWVGDEGKDFNKDWNGVWDVAVDRNEKGWFVEMMIPFSTLKFKNDSAQVWGINIERNIRHKKEQLLWQGWSRLYELEKISQGGKLVGIKNIKRENSVEILPYVLGGFEFIEDKYRKTGKIGGEVNFDITPTLKLNFTYNTDFAQAESDKKEINLSRFSLYYPEKRQFFLEGKNYYDLNVGDVNLFYSRRIGIDNKKKIPIIGGMRLFGKHNRTSVGIMSIQTESKKHIPTNNFSVVKLRQDIFKQSSVEFIATQKLSKNYYNRVYGGNFTYSTSEFFGNKNLVTGGSFALSETKKPKSESSLNKKNLSYDLFLLYMNDIVEYKMSFTTVEKDFNPEMGFLNRSNYQKLFAKLKFNPRFKNLPFFRNLIFKPLDIKHYINNITKKTESSFFEWSPFGFVSKSGDYFEINIQHAYDKPKEDFTVFGNNKITAGEYWDNRYELFIFTYSGRKISAFSKVNIGGFYNGKRQLYRVGLNSNINKHLNINIDWQKNDIQLSEKSFTTNELGSRIDYAFNPKLLTSVFGQWNNENQYLLVNYRINWIPKIGKYFYFVVNQEFDTKDEIKLNRTTILAKLTWRFKL